MEDIRKLLQEEQQRFFQREGILTITVAESRDGIDITEKILQKIVDKKTVLYLSGGKTPRIVYEHLAESATHPGAVGMIDERYGKKWHNNSNELMIRETGLLRILDIQGIPFYPILVGHPGVVESHDRISFGKDSIVPTSSALQNDKLRQEVSDRYDQKVRELLAQYSKNVGILGIGSDGHTAGLLPNGQWTADKGQKTNLVTSYESDDQFRDRITMTFLGLSMLDIIIILVFGDDKKHALQMMFSDGSEKEIPARFYIRPEIAKKTILITDQEIS